MAMANPTDAPRMKLPIFPWHNKPLNLMAWHGQNWGYSPAKKIAQFE